MEKNLIEKIEDLTLSEKNVLNVNVGILGHVDSGKTSLAKALSTIASTAAFDKNPQSKEKGITLDLGFSAFYIRTPNYIKEKFPDVERLQNSDYLQITLVDCPGHASLIRTVIAGASIIDTLILVIDCIKGIQTQTTECLILGEILIDKLVVAFNKVDLVKSEEIEPRINKIKQAFKTTKFGSNIDVIPVSASK
jgi:selenocysteine-specific elongation factor